MKKIQFQCDYSEGALPEILERLGKTNLEQTPGYGEDEYCEHARALIKEACGTPEADVHFLVGGTQANVTVISSILRPYQGVLCASTGHINVHETGAVEHGGHKVLPLFSADGLIKASQIEEAVSAHFADESFEHIVQPGMVYISFPSEFGTIYSKAELEAISEVCRRWNLPLFIDGARLGYGLTCDRCDLSLKDIASLSDVFYIGGTKQGALFGEAVVITNDALKKDFRYNIKQNGGMLAKGRLLGLQYEALFEDGLYFRAARHANELAVKVHEAFASKGYEFLVDSPTNQQFPILPRDVVERLQERFSFSIWQTLPDGRIGTRFCTSWATRGEAVEELSMFLLSL